MSGRFCQPGNRPVVDRPMDQGGEKAEFPPQFQRDWLEKEAKAIAYADADHYNGGGAYEDVNRPTPERLEHGFEAPWPTIYFPAIIANYPYSGLPIIDTTRYDHAVIAWKD